MGAVAALFEPLGLARLPALGDRSPWTHGPAVVLRDARLLPPLTSLVGALASQWWRSRGGGSCGSWCVCVLEPASRLLCGDRGRLEALYGPFLVTPRGVYVDASRGLLRVLDSGGKQDSCLDKYLELARHARRAAGSLLPGDRVRENTEAKKILDEMRSNGCLVGAEELLASMTRVGLNPGTKTVGYGLLYSQVQADYHGAAARLAGRDAPRAAVALTAHCSNEGETLEALVEVGPQGTPYRLTTHPVDTGTSHVAHLEPLWLATSPTPLRCTAEARCLNPLHPLAPPLTPVAWSYTRTGSRGEPLGYVKEAMMLGLAPGTLAWKEPPRLLAPLVTAPSLEELLREAKAALNAARRLKLL